jgi:hypothetical protein
VHDEEVTTAAGGGHNLEETEAVIQSRLSVALGGQHNELAGVN